MDRTHWGMAGTATIAVLIGAVSPGSAVRAAGILLAQSDAGGKITGAGSGSAAGAPNTVVDTSAGGVAGTGLGKMPPAGDAPGTGQSVKGPPGQGIPGTNSVKNPPGMGTAAQP